MKNMSINQIINLQISNENEGITPSLPLEWPNTDDRDTIAPPADYSAYMLACEITGD